MAFTLPKGDLYLTMQMIDREHKHVIYQDPELWAKNSHGYPDVPGHSASLHLMAQQYTQTGEGVLRCNISPDIIGGSSLNFIEDYPFNYIYIRRNGLVPGGTSADYATTKVGAFITSAKWINTGLIEYTYEIDPIVTYYPYSFDSTKDMIVTRSNATFYRPDDDDDPSDIVDYNYIHRDVQMGLSEPWDSYLGSIVRKRKIASILPDNYYFVLVVSTDGNTWTGDNDRMDNHRFGVKAFGDTFSCFRYTLFTANPTESGIVSSLSDLKDVLKSYEINNQLEGIVGLYYMPWDISADSHSTTERIGQRGAHTESGISVFPGVWCWERGIVSGGQTINYTEAGTSTGLDLREYLVYPDEIYGLHPMVYKPRFEKLCRYPYHYLEVIDKVSGATHQYQIENFIFDDDSESWDGSIGFGWTATIFPEVSISVYPTQYMGSDFHQLDRGFTIPVCQVPYTLDLYEKWLNINKSFLDSQRQANTVGSIASVAGGIVTAIAGGFLTATGVGAEAGIPMIMAGGAAMLSGGSNVVNAGIGMKQNQLAYEQQMKAAATMPLQTHTGTGNVAWTLGIAMPEIFEVTANPDVLKWADRCYMHHYGQTRATIGVDFDLDKELRGARTSNGQPGDYPTELFIQTRGFYPMKVNSSHPGIRNQIADIFDKGVRIHTSPQIW